MSDEKQEAKPTELTPYANNFSDAVKAAIGSNDIAESTETVKTKASKTGPDGKPIELEYVRNYSKLVAKTPQGALVLAAERAGKDESNEAALLRMVTDSFDAGVRMNVRNSIITEVAGPEAQIDRIAKQFAKLLGIDEKAAREMVVKQPEIQALLGKSETEPVSA